MTERAKRVLALAQESAEMTGAQSIGTEHLLLGLLREEDGPHMEVLARLGIDRNMVRALYRDARELVRARHAQVIDGEAQEVDPTALPPGPVC